MLGVSASRFHFQTQACASLRLSARGRSRPIAIATQGGQGQKLPAHQPIHQTGGVTRARYLLDELPRWAWPSPRAMALLRAAVGQPLSPRPTVPARHHPAPSLIRSRSRLSFEFSLPPHPGVRAFPRIEATARRGARTENPKVRNRRLQKKFNGTATKPRLSVFCSTRQLYAVLADDHNKKVLFYGSTLQKSICGDPPCTTVEAARRVGEELVRVCNELGVSEISSYDRNGFARGDKMMAFEDPVSQHGFLLR
ncbi:hypothetical protein U9M48_006259 [Paspalum notatum var. saurae]|uniref:50S ribosomal protein L18, chloroplastic n=1 Tax=Paspalum notatum var. saurae TaxID=547442 RepID=A0AAQ3SJ92_PASNO